MRQTEPDYNTDLTLLTFAWLVVAFFVWGFGPEDALKWYFAATCCLVFALIGIVGLCWAVTAFRRRR